MEPNPLIPAELTVAPYQSLVFLVRHAETEWNKEQRFQGHLNVPLSSVGCRQAEALGDWLGSLALPFAALYISDLGRAVQTAQAVGISTGLSPVAEPALREIHCGEWQGMLASEIATRYPEQLNAWRTVVDSYAMPGGESLVEVQARIYHFYTEAASRHAGQVIILVTHGAALTALVAAITKADLGESWRERRLRYDNTCVSVVLQDLNRSEGQLLLSNSVQHLERLTAVSDGWPAIGLCPTPYVRHRQRQ